MRTRLLFALIAVSMASRAFADKVIMKDGKIYEGHIMGESPKAVLISNPPLDPKPRFLDMSQVATLVRESHPAEKRSVEEGRFFSANIGVSGTAFSSSEFTFSPAPSLYAGGAFRIHPFVELDGEMDYTPSLEGTGLAISDGTNTREYDTFYAYHGGFALKFFPFFKRTDWRMEPYLTTGYHWNHLIPKASGDSLSGHSIIGGFGVMFPWFKPLYWDARFLYDHTTYDSVKFLANEGDLDGIGHDGFTLSIGLSYRFL